MSDTPEFSSAEPRRLWPIAAAGVVLLAVLAAIVIWLSQDRDTAATAPTPAVTGTLSVAAKPSGSAAAGVEPVPTSAPAGVTWALVGQAAVPVSTTDGPTSVTGNRASGFARTPAGALIAATQISTRAGYSSGRSIWEPALQNQFVVSQDRDTLLQLLRDADVQGQPIAQPGELSQVAGFRFISYTDQSAAVGLVRRTPKGGYSMTTLTVQWADGDWKLVAPPGGHWPAVTTTMADLTGIVAWGAS